MPFENTPSQAAQLDTFKAEIAATLSDQGIAAAKEKFLECAEALLPDESAVARLHTAAICMDAAFALAIHSEWTLGCTLTEVRRSRPVPLRSDLAQREWEDRHPLGELLILDVPDDEYQPGMACGGPFKILSEGLHTQYESYDLPGMDLVRLGEMYYVTGFVPAGQEQMWYWIVIPRLVDCVVRKTYEGPWLDATTLEERDIL